MEPPQPPGDEPADKGGRVVPGLLEPTLDANESELRRATGDCERSPRATLPGPVYAAL